MLGFIIYDSFKICTKQIFLPFVGLELKSVSSSKTSQPKISNAKHTLVMESKNPKRANSV